MKFFTWFYPNLIVGRIVIAQISVSPEFIMKNTVHVTENYYSNPPAKSGILSTSTSLIYYIIKKYKIKLKIFFKIRDMYCLVQQRSSMIKMQKSTLHLITMYINI